MNIFNELQEINRRLDPFNPCTTRELWTDPHIGKRMFELSFDPNLGAVFGVGTKARAIEWMIDHFKIGPNTKILHLGSGPGFYTQAFAKTGAHVTGIDFSPFAIEYAQKSAKQEHLAIRYVCEDYLKFSSSEKFDLIFFTGRNLCALSPAQQSQILDRLHNWLADEGRVFLDVYTYARFDSVIEKKSSENHPKTSPISLPAPFSYQPQNGSFEYCPGNGFWSQDPYYVFMDVFKYDLGDEKFFARLCTITRLTRCRSSIM